MVNIPYNDSQKTAEENAVPVVRVALPVPLKQEFDYSHTEALERGVRVTVPFGHRTLNGIVTDNVELPDTTQTLKNIQSVIDLEALNQSMWWSFIEKASSYYFYPLGEVLQQALPKVIRGSLPLNALRPKAFARTSAEASVRGIKQIEALELLEDGPKTSAQFRSRGISSSVINRLVELALIEETDIDDYWPANLLDETPPEPNDEQQHAIELITHADEFKVTALNGVTGSGKTEVYLRAIEASLSKQRQVLILVPEISLTPQTLQRFKSRFNVEMAVLHSARADKEKAIDWVAAHDGRAKIVIGTRSAILCSMPNLGLIIVDEEHDGSYKQQDTFRYCARDLAVLRGQIHNCPVVLGSATLSLETLHNIDTGRYQRCDLNHRATGAKLPTVEVIDTRSKTKDTGFTHEALEALAETVANNRQAMVFLNRRGYSPTLMCDQCGWIADCPLCYRHLTVHQRHRLLRCHPCDHQQNLLYSCPSCHSQQITRIGEGTERCEDRLTELFPNVPIIRVDRDTANSSNKLNQQLEKIESSDAAIIVGTQMLAKGHHFARLDCVVVLDLDAGLHSADFRGAERTGQLLTQVIGRAGRESEGKVLLQTAVPDHPLLQPLLINDYERFSQLLIEERSRLKLPPFSASLLIRVNHPFENEVNTLLRQLRQYVDRQNIHGIQVFGPMPAPHEFRGGRCHGQLFITHPDRKTLRFIAANLDQALRSVRQKSGLRASIDIDPRDMN